MATASTRPCGIATTNGKVLPVNIKRSTNDAVRSAEGLRHSGVKLLLGSAFIEFITLGILFCYHCRYVIKRKLKRREDRDRQAGNDDFEP